MYCPVCKNKLKKLGAVGVSNQVAVRCTKCKKTYKYIPRVKPEENEEYDDGLWYLYQHN